MAILNHSKGLNHYDYHYHYGHGRCMTT